MKSRRIRAVWLIVATLLVGRLGWLVVERTAGSGGADRREARLPAPVEVSAVEHGPIELRRTFSGTLEAPAEFVVAPKVSGRIERLAVDLADAVARGQVVAELDDEEYRQAVAQAEADVAVARANLGEARSSLEIAERELRRMTTLRDRGIASESQFDTATVEHLARQAKYEVAQAHVTRAESALESARIRLGYTRVPASWTGGRDERVVAERFVDEGDTVAANTPLLSIVELHPMKAAFYVTEKDYGYMHPDQVASLATDAFPGESFGGHVARIAPVFREASRQALVELKVENPEHRLKPGMFVRAEIVLDRVEDATIVPVDALVRRDGDSVLFVVDSDGAMVSMRPVEVGIRDGARVQVSGDGIRGRVVTLGQQLLDDGSPITIPGERDPSVASGSTE